MLFEFDSHFQALTIPIATGGDELVIECHEVECSMLSSQVLSMRLGPVS